MPALTRTQIQTASDIKTERVDVPEWGGYVIAKAMTGFEREQFEQMVAQPGADGKVQISYKQMRITAVIACAVDDNGAHIFTDADRDWLNNKSGAALDRVASVILRLSGISQGATETAVENFTPDLSDDSSSA